KMGERTRLRKMQMISMELRRSNTVATPAMARALRSAPHVRMWAEVAEGVARCVEVAALPFSRVPIVPFVPIGPNAFEIRGFAMVVARDATTAIGANSCRRGELRGGTRVLIEDCRTPGGPLGVVRCFRFRSKSINRSDRSFVCAVRGG